jgi:signal transduction histidine kinase
VKTDIKRMQQVLLNLLSNAIKFTPSEGRVVVLVEKLKAEQILETDKIRISVTDNGLGIKKKNQGKLFQMFGTFKNSKRGINTKGIGLGLVICKLIVGNFNGQIKFHSKYKAGTTFFFTFEVSPLNPEEMLTLVNFSKDDI